MIHLHELKMAKFHLKHNLVAIVKGKITTTQVVRSFFSMTKNYYKVEEAATRSIKVMHDQNNGGLWWFWLKVGTWVQKRPATAVGGVLG